jgi:small subunit ribosomal protein S4e
MAKLKRLLVPKFWKVPRKVKTWAVSPRPGPHKKFESIPLQIMVRDILKLVETGKEAKNIIKKGEVFVDGEPRKDHAYPAGLFDVVSFPRTKEFYRIIPTSHGLGLVKIDEKESKLKICRINGKSLVKGKKIQLSLHDGKNILVDDNKYKVGDSLLLELPSLKIVQHLPLAPRTVGIVSKGTDSGKIGDVKEIVAGKAREPSRVICELDGKTEEVLKERFIVVGKDKPLIIVSE